MEQDITISCEERFGEDTLLASGVLKFLNDEGTTVSLLQNEIPLNGVAAGNIVAHRDGVDEEYGTDDDDLFGTLEEVLAVRQIGPASLLKLLEYALAYGWIPAEDELSGVYDGVPFSVMEARSVVVFVNDSSFEELDEDVGLDRRAALSITSRPVKTVLELSKRYFVGNSALGVLKKAALEEPPMDFLGGGEDCGVNDRCDDGLRCVGVPADGSPRVGKCVNQNPGIEGYWSECSLERECNEGLDCVGTTAFGGAGWCAYPWMSGTYESTGDVLIPDENAEGASMNVVVYGLATVPMDIMVTLDIDHPRPADLVVTLRSTNGSDSVLWKNEASPLFYLSASGIERDNYINGRFTLNVVDTVGGELGTLRGVKLWVTSRFD